MYSLAARAPLARREGGARRPRGSTASPAPFAGGFRVAGGGEESGASSLCRRILVVDDHPDSADTLSAVLDLLGHRVTTAYDGPSALEGAIEARPDVAVLDIGMPGMHGYELARRLRALPRGEEIVLIALTGWVGAKYRRLSREAGFDHFLAKPVSLDSLVGAIGSVVGRAG
jgi:CheY-like chemotaxis protein